MDWLATHSWIIAIRRGFTLSLPVVMFAAFATALGHIPLADFVSFPGLPTIQHFFAEAGAASFGIMSLFLVLTVSYSLASLKSPAVDQEVYPVVVALISLLCFLALILPGDGQLRPELFGMKSVLPAVITGLVATELFHHLLSYPRLILFRSLNDADPILPSLLQVLVPAALTLGAFFLFHSLTSWGQQPAAAFFTSNIERLFDLIESPLLMILMYVLINQALWFFGIHGSAVLKPVEDSYLNSATQANILSTQLGEPATEVITKPFLDVFVLMGGSGVSLALIIAILVFWKRSNQFRLARLSLIPALFNISEIIVFALPVVLNPTFLIPFILTPLVLVLTTYIATISGFIPPIDRVLSWTTPPLIGGYLATDSWRGVALQLFNLAVAVFIYTPFVFRAQQQFYQLRQQNFRAMMGEIQAIMNARTPQLIHRHDRIGSLARQLSADLAEDLGTDRVYLLYQPQLNSQGKVIGAEALIRWNHPIFGPIPANIIICIAEESDLIHRLGHWVFETACQQLQQWKQQGVTDFKVSINVSPSQLAESNFFTLLNQSLKRTGVITNEVELEITESTEVGHNDASLQALETLASMDFRIAMDDFGMGYTSLLYLRRFSLHTVKLDGSLTKDVIHNQSCRDIISAVAALCQSKQLRIVAEYVETSAQRDLLKELGCEVFQGYYFSKPIPAEEVIPFCQCSQTLEPCNDSKSTIAAVS